MRILEDLVSSLGLINYSDNILSNKVLVGLGGSCWVYIGLINYSGDILSNKVLVGRGGYI